VISGSGLTAVLNTNGVTPGSTIRVIVKGTSEVDNCSASGEIRVSTRMPLLAPPPPLLPLVLQPCPRRSSPLNLTRIDNVCKDILLNIAVTKLQSEPTARLVIVTYRGSGEKKIVEIRRFQNVHECLVREGGIDPNRIIAKAGGVLDDLIFVRPYLIPEGADFQANDSMTPSTPEPQLPTNPHSRNPTPNQKRPQRKK